MSARFAVQHGKFKAEIKVLTELLLLLLVLLV